MRSASDKVFDVTASALRFPIVLFIMAELATRTLCQKRIGERRLWCGTCDCGVVQHQCLCTRVSKSVRVCPDGSRGPHVHSIASAFNLFVTMCV